MRSTIIFVLAFTSAVLAVPTRTGRDTFCQAMCYPFEPTCETGMFPKKESDNCYVCCKESTTPSNVPEVPGSPPVDAVCQAMCYPFQPTCESGMFSKKESDNCYVCCKKSTTPSSVPGSPPVTVADSCPGVAQ